MEWSLPEFGASRILYFMIETASEKSQPPIEIPFSALSSDAQEGVIDNFIWREGTDYGSNEISHETKVAQIRAQIDDGRVKLVFDPGLDSVTLMTDRDWRQLLKRAAEAHG